MVGMLAVATSAGCTRAPGGPCTYERSDTSCALVRIGEDSLPDGGTVAMTAEYRVAGKPQPLIVKSFECAVGDAAALRAHLQANAIISCSVGHIVEGACTPTWAKLQIPRAKVACSAAYDTSDTVCAK
jgi:hypothetical protein